jgi:hypothetical protein
VRGDAARRQSGTLDCTARRRVLAAAAVQPENTEWTALRDNRERHNIPLDPTLPKQSDRSPHQSVATSPGPVACRNQDALTPQTQNRPKRHRAQNEISNLQMHGRGEKGRTRSG